MGITIYACGKIDRIGDIPLLISEAKVVAREGNRAYQVIDDDVHAQPETEVTQRDRVDPVSTLEGSAGLKGIIINLDPEADPLSILFDRSGVLTDRNRYASWIQSNGQSERYTAFKTRFTSIDPRLRIGELFANLKKKYMTNLVVSDEQAFWKTRDRRIMKDERIILGHCLRYADLVIGGIELSDEAVRNSETVETRIEEALLKTKNPITGKEPVDN